MAHRSLSPASDKKSVRRYSPDSKSSSCSSISEHRRDDSPSRSRSRTPDVRNRWNSRTLNENRRFQRERPTQSRCIGVFGLSVYTTQQKIREIFSKFGPIERIQVVIDAQTRRSRGFCFIYYIDINDARVAKNECCGLEVDGRRIRVDYSITQRPHTPTPGFYKGRRIQNYNRDDRENERERSRERDYNRSYRRNSRSRYESSRNRRSRSRSYSPPRHSRR